MTPTEKIEQALSELYSRESAYEQAAVAFVEKEHAYKVAYASAVLRSEATSADRRDAEAVLITKEEMLALVRAKVAKEISKAKLDDCLAAISARQSLLSFEVKVLGKAALNT